MLKNNILFSFLFLAVGILSCQQENGENQSPNIIVILADDLGYGDLSCYQPNSIVKTVHLYRMACEGMRFSLGKCAVVEYLSSYLSFATKKRTNKTPETSPNRSFSRFLTGYI